MRWEKKNSSSTSRSSKDPSRACHFRPQELSFRYFVFSIPSNRLSTRNAKPYARVCHMKQMSHRLDRFLLFNHESKIHIRTVWNANCWWREPIFHIMGAKWELTDHAVRTYYRMLYESEYQNRKHQTPRPGEHETVCGDSKSKTSYIGSNGCSQATLGTRVKWNFQLSQNTTKITNTRYQVPKCGLRDPPPFFAFWQTVSGQNGYSAWFGCPRIEKMHRRSTTLTCRMEVKASSNEPGCKNCHVSMVLIIGRLTYLEHLESLFYEYALHTRYFVPGMMVQY